MTSLGDSRQVEKPRASELLDRLAKVFPAIEEAGGDEVQLAKAAGLPVEVVQRALADAEVVDALAAAHRAAEIDGTLLRAAAVKVALAMLWLTAKSLDAGEADLDDVANLLPKVFRIVEHADDVETRRKGGAMPVVHITFGGEGDSAIEVIERVEPTSGQVSNPTSLEPRPVALPQLAPPEGDALAVSEVYEQLTGGAR